MKIYEQKRGSSNEADRLELGRLLMKAGYTVRLGKERDSSGNRNVHYVEYWSQEEGAKYD